VLVGGSDDEGLGLCRETCDARGWDARNTGVNPLTTEGKKTAALESAEQWTWRAAEVVAVSVGDGSIISGLYKGFYDLQRLGWIDSMPRLIGIQAEGSAVLANAFHKGLAAQDIRPEPASTIADSIASSLPRDRAKALRALRRTGGTFLTVADAEIQAAIPELAQLSGVFAEPAAAAAYAGLKAAARAGVIEPGESACILSTGNGLKDVARARKSVKGGIRVAADFRAVASALCSAGLI